MITFILIEVDDFWIEFIEYRHILLGEWQAAQVIDQPYIQATCPQFVKRFRA